MARIRIVDQWMRSPVSPQIRHRSIMVIAETWAEQKVLMRAFASSLDQTQPTIGLQGQEIPISPAGTDAHGPWGIHVQPPVDGRAQQLREQLQSAAKWLAGSKGNPPRLEDEAPADERIPTTPWTPPADPRLASASGPQERTVHAASPGRSPGPASGPHDRTALPGMLPTVPQGAPPPAYPSASGAPMHAIGPGQNAPYHRSAAAGYAPRAPGQRAPTPMPSRGRGAAPNATRSRNMQPARARRARQTQNPPTGARTALGYSSPSQPLAAQRSYHRGPNRSSLATVVGRTMPVGFQLHERERAVLDALSRERQLTAARVSELSGAGDGHDYMQRLMVKLGSHGLDLVELRDGIYRLRA